MLSAIEHATVGGTVLDEIDYKYDVFADLISRSETISGVTTTTHEAFRIENPAPGITQTVNTNWADLTSGNSLNLRYVFDYVSMTPISRLNATTFAWIMADHQRSTIVITDMSGTVLKTIKYDGFGNITATTGSGDLGVILFAGYRWDSATGLFSAHWRWYNPLNGQWTTVDPIGFKAGSNPRRYSDNNTPNATDSSGLDMQTLKYTKVYPDVKMPVKSGDWTVGEIVSIYANPTLYTDRADLVYKPKPKTFVGFIEFVQLISVTDLNGKPVFTGGFEENSRRADKIDGWAVDQKPENGFKHCWYLRAKDGGVVGGELGRLGGKSAEGTIISAILKDTPRIKFEGRIFQFETFAVDRLGTLENPKPGGTVLSGISWGFTITDDGGIKPSEIKEIQHYQSLYSAIGRWNAQPGNVKLGQIKLPVRTQPGAFVGPLEVNETWSDQ